MSYLIILDTNIVFNDFHFKSSNIKKLLKFTRHMPVSLCITEFNYYEILKKYKDQVRPIIKRIKGTKSELLRLEVKEVVDYDKLKVQPIVDRYKNTLDTMIEENNIVIIKFPTSNDVTEKISLKYFNNKKPFDENKESFQDAIIWESIVEYCNDNKPENIVFISNNHKDFANKDKNSIHEDLSGDIIGDLIYYESLTTFLKYEEDNLKDYFIDNYEYDEESIIEELKFYCDGNEAIQYTVDNMLMNTDFQGDYINGWGSYGSIEEYDISISEVSLDIEENSLLISFAIELNVSFSIETPDPTYEKGDSGDGLISEGSSTNILIQSNITYDLDNEELMDYVELDSQFC